MSDQKQQSIPVIPLTFREAVASEDGKVVLFDVLDANNKANLVQVAWENLSRLAHLLNFAGVDAAEKRKSLGESDMFTGAGTAQLVSGFSIRDVPEKKLRVLSLHSPSGLRSDFVLPLEGKDSSGRSLLKVLAENLGR